MATVNVANNAEWQTYESAGLVPGNEYLLATGNYPDRFVFPNSGTSTQRITVGAQPGHTPKVTGGGSVAWEMSGLQFITIQDITFDGGALYVDSAISGIAINARGCNRCYFTGCTFTKIQTRAIDIRTSSYCVIDNCTVLKVGGQQLVAGVFKSGGGGFQMDQCYRCKITNCDLRELGHNGIEGSEPIQCIVRNNYISPRWTGGDMSNYTYRGWTMESGALGDWDTRDGNLMEYNEIYDTGDNGDGKKASAAKFRGNGPIIRFNIIHKHTSPLKGQMLGGTVGGSDFSVCKHLKIYNNTIYRPIQTQAVDFQINANRSTDIITGVTLKNNIIHEANKNTSLPSFSLGGDSSLAGSYYDMTNNNFSGNCVFYASAPDGTVQLDNPTFNDTLTAAEALASLDSSIYGNIQADPQMVDPGGAPPDFTLLGGSPCLGTASYLTYISSGGGFGKVIPVNDAWYFFDGNGWTGDADWPETPDTIIILRNGSRIRATIASIAYGTNVITLTENVNWASGDLFTLADAEDIGAEQTAAGASFVGEDNGYTIAETTTVDPKVALATLGAAAVTVNDSAGAIVSGVGAVSGPTATGSGGGTFSITSGGLDLDYVALPNYNGDDRVLYWIDSDAASGYATVTVTPASAGGDDVVLIEDSFIDDPVVEVEAHTPETFDPSLTPAAWTHPNQSAGTIGQVLTATGLTFDAAGTRAFQQPLQDDVIIEGTMDCNSDSLRQYVFVRWTDDSGGNHTGYRISLRPQSARTLFVLERLNSGTVTPLTGTGTDLPFTKTEGSFSYKLEFTGDTISTWYDIGAGYVDAWTNYVDTSPITGGGTLVGVGAETYSSGFPSVLYFKITGSSGAGAATPPSWVDPDFTGGNALGIARGTQNFPIPTGNPTVQQAGTIMALCTAGSSSVVNVDDVAAPVNCSVVYNGGANVLVTPTGLSLTGSFDAILVAEDGGTVTGTVSLEFTNATPVAAAGVTLTCGKGNSVQVITTTGATSPTGKSTGAAWATDSNGDTITIAEKVAPTNGTLTTVTTPVVVYKHDGSNTTTDTFTLSTYDGIGFGTDIVVTVTIQAPNAVDDIYSVARNTIDAPLNVLINDENDLATGLSIWAVNGTQMPATVDVGNGTVRRVGVFPNEQLYYTPDTNSIASDTFTYTVINSEGSTSQASVTVNISTDPNTIAIKNMTIAVDTGVVGLKVHAASAVTLDFTETVTYLLVSDVTTMTSSLDTSTGIITLSSIPDPFVSDTMTIDASTASSEEAVEIVITFVPSALQSVNEITVESALREKTVPSDLREIT